MRTMTHIEVAVAEGHVTTWAGTVYASASDLGVRVINLPRWTERTEAATGADNQIVVAHSDSTAAERHLRQALAELVEYFAGERHEFTVPLDLQGSAFHRRVWDEVARVPYGETRSYGEIARTVGAPQASRAVGMANGANPVAPIVPCHRIVGSTGRLTGYGPGLPLKRRLLVMEGAMADSTDEYEAWVRQISDRMGSETWITGARSTGIYCRPSCSAARRSHPAPNPVFATAAEAEASGYRACRLCLAA